MKKILVAENLSYRINDTKLFQNLSFSLNEGAAIHFLPMEKLIQFKSKNLLKKMFWRAFNHHLRLLL